jgi:pyruvate dehydrogenase E2 component (dihydrolipoamide acetyltransferase)
MAKILGLPKLSPTVEEGTLVSWVKKEGDSVDVDDLLAEVETDKATMEFRSFDRGVLLKILVPEGETLKPDTPVAILGKAGEDISALVEEAKKLGGSPAPSAAAADSESDWDNEPTATGTIRAAKRASQPPRAPSVEPPAPAASPSGNRESDGRILASPLVRRLAREHDVDLGEVQGSGPHGRIVKRDLDAAMASPRSAPAPGAMVTSAGASFARQPAIVEKASATRRTIAKRLTQSKQEVPHYYLTIDVDATLLLEAREELMSVLARENEKISVNDLLIKGCAVALRRVPAVNASWIDGTIHRHQVVDVSVAVAIPEGLVTPVVRDADRKGVLEIAREVRDLAKRAREKKLKAEEMRDGTFSISNLGMYGIESFAAVINPPEGAILAVGAVRDEPVVRDGAVVPGKRMRVTLSCDHRVIDGAVGAEFLKVLRAFLEKPATMLL